MRLPHYIHSIINNITRNITNKTSQPMLGRWKLKYSNDDLSLFYNQIPDPGYTVDIYKTKIKETNDSNRI